MKAATPSHHLSNRTDRLTGAGVVMADVQSWGVCRVMWIGERQWEGLPGVFVFYPVFGSESAWSYQVSCIAQDFLRLGKLEHVRDGYSCHTSPPGPYRRGRLRRKK